MKTFHCSDAGFDCGAVVQAVTEDEVLKIAAEHAQKVHGVTVSREMAEQIRSMIRDEDAIKQNR